MIIVISICIQDKMIFTYKLLVKKNVKKVLHIICPVRFGFQNTRNCQTVQAIKLSNHERLIFTIGVLYGPGSFHGR
jgi:hypothetical protein